MSEDEVSAKLPTTYVQIHVSGLRAFAKEQYYDDIVHGMKHKLVVEFIDVEGERNAVNGRFIDLVWISSEETRATGRAHSKMVDAEEEPSW